uniref:Uncharacterized protein n=1 Tax=Zeugodacus cucurbitae TaxID=28588 RepID=A0A0A1WS77_ZEUCU
MSPQFCMIAVMSIALFGTFASADVSSLGYNRFGRVTTRLQRQELGAAPYPAAGYRPRQPFEFPTPDKQQFFPNGGEGERPHSLAQPQPQPQFQPEPQYEPQPQSQPEPEPLPQAQAEPQPQAQPEPEVNGFDLEAIPNLGANGDHIDAPNTLYDAPSRFRVAQAGRQRFSFSRQQFSAAAAPQPRQHQNFRQNFEATAPQRTYGAPAQNSEGYPRQRQQFTAAQQSFAEAPQRAYGAPAAEEEPQAESLKSAVKSERITAEQPEQQREEREEEAEVATDIEVTEVKKTTPAAPAAPTPTTNVFYYPATAVGFVHPLTAAYYQPTTFYAAAAAAPAPAPTPAVATTAAPVSAERQAPAAEADAKPAQVSALAAQTAVPAIATLAAPQFYAAPRYLQQYTFAAPAQLQAW